MWAELVEYWGPNTDTPIQVTSQILVYALFGGLGVFVGWVERGARK